MHLFGLTGGIASGKSTAAARLRERRVPVIDADDLAREVVRKGTPGLAAVVAVFGPSVLDDAGALDRQTLGRLVFSDPRARAQLNAILHPLIRERTAKRAIELAAEGEPLACYEAALLVETGSADAFRPLVVVACPEDIQLARLRSRDRLSLAEARARISAQMPLSEKAAVADFVIETGGTMDDTKKRVDEVLDTICGRLSVRIPIRQ